MNERCLTDREVAQLKEKRLPDSLAEVEAHLASCDRCRERVVPARSAEALLATLQGAFAPEVPSGHLSYEKALDYTDERLEEVDREIVDLHLEVCEQCAAMVAGLRDVAPIVRAARLSSEKREPLPALATAADPVAGNAAPRADAGSPVTAVMTTSVSLTPDASSGTTRRLLSWLIPAWRRNETEKLQAKTSDRLPQGLIWGAAAVCLAALAAGYGVLVWPLRERVRGLQDTTGKLQQQADMDRQQISELAREKSAAERTRDAQARVANSAALWQRRYKAAIGERDRYKHLYDGLALNSRPVRSLSPAQKANGPEIVAALPNDWDAIRPSKMQTMSGTANDHVYHLLKPVCTETDTDRPTLQWESVPGIKQYLLTVTPENADETSPVLEEQSVTGVSYTFSKPLKRGKVYRWLVTTVPADGDGTRVHLEPDNAKFKILSADRAAALHRDQGALDMRAGLLEEAQQEFEKCLQLQPHDMQAGKWLRQLQKARRP